MTDILAYIISPVLLLFVILWFLFGNLGATQNGDCPSTIEDCLRVDEQLLDETERRLAEFDAMIREIRVKRREAALSYLGELRDDYLRVEHLLNRAAKFLPELTVKGESARISLAVRFRIEYRLARLQVQLGFVPAASLKALTAKLRQATTWANQVLNEVSRGHGLPVLESDLKSGR